MICLGVACPPGHAILYYVPVCVFPADDPEGRSNALALGDQLLNEHVPAWGADDRFRHADGDVALSLSEDDRREARGIAALRTAPGRSSRGLPPWSMQVFLTPGHEDRLGELVARLLPDSGTEVWIRPENEKMIRLLQRRWPSAFSCRRLHLMLVDLPVATEPLATRALDPSNPDDVAAIVRINNAAFAEHPDQAGMTEGSVRERLAQPGNCPEGVRLAEIDGAVNGFCWTQIHDDRSLGEISVIGLHPDMQGRGLGGPMTAAGLHWMSGRGVPQAILYVEAHNGPAVRSYRRLGFATVQDDVSWIIPGGATTTDADD